MPLDQLVAEIGSQTATLLGSPPSARAVHGVEFHDALEELPDKPGFLLLAPSSAAEESATASNPNSYERFRPLIQRAASGGASAIAIKCRDSDEAVIGKLSDEFGIPVIRVAEPVSWRLFDAVLSRLLGEHRFTEDSQRDRGTEPLFALANEVAGFFGGSVAIEDLGRRILAYSSVPGQVIDRLRTQGILTRKVPDSPFNDDQYRTVLRSDTPIKYPRLSDEEPRVAFAIRAGTLPLGTIWAIDASGDDAITDAQHERIVSAAAIAAAHMLDDIRVRKATQLPREGKLRTLLEGHDVVGSELAELGLPEERGSCLLAFSPADDQRETVLPQLHSTVQRHLALHRPAAVAAIRGDNVYALLPYEPSLSNSSVIDPLLPIIDRLVGPGTRVASVGTAHRSIDVAPLRRLADRLLETAAAHPASTEQRILTVDALRPLLVIERVSELLATETELSSPQLEQLLAADGTYAKTLLAWCSNFGNVARAARDLGVHENTVRYRLRQAEEQHGVRLSDPDMLLVTWLQLRAG